MCYFGFYIFKKLCKYLVMYLNRVLNEKIINIIHINYNNMNNNVTVVTSAVNHHSKNAVLLTLY